MQTEPGDHVARSEFCPELTARMTLIFAQEAADAGQDHCAHQLVSIAHDLFALKFAADGTPGQLVANPGD